MEEKKWCVYKHDSPSGKVYIGITCQKLNRRWRDGEGYNRNTYFYRAIQKYGWDNFQHNILESNLTEKEANLKEIEYIEKYKSNNPEYGYNIESGGNASKMSESSKRKLSKIARNRAIEPRNISIYMMNENCEILREFSSIQEVERELNIKAQHVYDALSKLNNYANGYYWCRKDEYEKYITKHKVHRDKVFKKVYVFSLNYNLLGEYESISKASKLTGVNKAFIRRVIRHENYSAHDLIFSASKSLEEHISAFNNRKRKRRKVAQYDNDYNLIAIFESPMEAAKSLNKKQSSCIVNCCNGVSKNAYGYIWRYADEEGGEYGKDT